MTEEWNECGGIPYCEFRYEGINCEDDIIWTDEQSLETNEIEDNEIKDYLDYLKVKYGYEIEQDPDNEFNPIDYFVNDYDEF